VLLSSHLSLLGLHYAISHVKQNQDLLRSISFLYDLQLTYSPSIHLIFLRRFDLHLQEAVSWPE